MSEYLKSKYDYIDYKYLGKSVIVADNYVSIEILSYLDRLGFPMCDNFVYVYKDLILKVIDKLKKVLEYGDNSCLELISMLNNSDSEIYRGIALDLGISLDELVLSLDMVIFKIDMDKMDESLLGSVCEEYSYELNYGELAFVIASMVLGYKKEKRNNKIKIRSL